MRWAAFIFALYLLAVAVYPCCLDHDCSEELAHHYDLHEHDHDYAEDDHEGCSPCSPFHSCNAQVKTEQARNFLIPPAVFLPLYEAQAPEYAEYCFVAPNNAIWQPPRFLV
jgi:hypothetical protein